MVKLRRLKRQFMPWPTFRSRSMATQPEIRNLLFIAGRIAAGGVVDSAEQDLVLDADVAITASVRLRGIAIASARAGDTVGVEYVVRSLCLLGKKAAAKYNEPVLSRVTESLAVLIREWLLPANARASHSKSALSGLREVFEDVVDAEAEPSGYSANLSAGITGVVGGLGPNGVAISYGRALSEWVAPDAVGQANRKWLIERGDELLEFYWRIGRKAAASDSSLCTSVSLDIERICIESIRAAAQRIDDSADQRLKLLIAKFSWIWQDIVVYQRRRDHAQWDVSAESAESIGMFAVHSGLPDVALAAFKVPIAIGKVLLSQRWALGSNRAAQMLVLALRGVASLEARDAPDEARQLEEEARKLALSLNEPRADLQGPVLGIDQLLDDALESYSDFVGQRPWYGLFLQLTPSAVMESVILRAKAWFKGELEDPSHEGEH